MLSEMSQKEKSRYRMITVISWKIIKKDSLVLIVGDYLDESSEDQSIVGSLP